MLEVLEPLAQKCGDTPSIPIGCNRLQSVATDREVWCGNGRETTEVEDILKKIHKRMLRYHGWPHPPTAERMTCPYSNVLGARRGQTWRSTFNEDLEEMGDSRHGARRIASDREN